MTTIHLKVLKKAIALFLVLIMVTVTAPFVYADDEITLSESNIINYPTTSGEMYYGQKVSDHITLSGGEVKYDGEIVAGHFEFTNPDLIPSANAAMRASIKFVPDLTKYSGFEITNSPNVTFLVKKTTPVLVDTSELPVATSVDAGAKLSASTLSGGQVKNPYNESESKALAAKWRWTTTSTVVEKSGYYEARMVISNNYEVIYQNVWVQVNGDTTTAVEVVEMPIISDVQYKDGLTAGDLTISGGKASVDGVFKVKDASQALVGGNNTVAIVFIPNDTTLKEVELSLTVNVKKLTTFFVDEGGNEITPEIRIPFNANLNSGLATYIEKLSSNCGEFSVSRTTAPVSIDTSKIAEYEYTATIMPKNNNYASADLAFKLIIEPLEVTPKFSVYGNDEYEITTGDYTKKPRGTYDLYVDGELVMEDINYQERFTWRPEKSGTYDLKAVYNPVENDTYKVNDVVLEDHVKNLTWKINCINCGAYDYKYGETATVMHSLGNQFAGWVFYDENGNEFTPENVVADESTSSVKFTMPDFSLTVKAKIVGEVDDNVDNDDNSGSGSGSAGSTSIFSRFIEFLRNLFEKYINIFKTVFGMFAPAN